MSKLITQTKFQILLIIILTSLAYSNIFNNNFATDDIGYVFNWKIDKEFANIPKLFTTDSVPEDERGVYRPVKAVFLMLTYKIWGFNVFGYHLNGLLVHLISTSLVFLITKEIVSSIKGQVSSKKPLILNTYYLIPLFTALVFGLHPIHTESITFILASFDSFGFLFELAAFYFYIRSSEKLLAKPSTLYAVSLVFAALAFFTYELTVTLPLLIILYDYCFRFKSLKFLKQFKLLMPYFLILGSYFFIRFNLLGLTTRGEYLDGSFYTTMLVMSRAFVEYIKLLLWPQNLSLNHQIFPGIFSVISKEYMDLNVIKSITISTPEVIASVVVILSLAVFGWKARSKYPLITFCLAWFFISLLPASFIFPQSSIMAERYAYLASYGFCLLVGWGLIRLVQSAKLKVKSLNLFLIFVFCLLIFYGIRIYVRNEDWKDTQTVWEKLASQNPNDPQANLFLAKIYYENKDYLQAEIYFKKANVLSPKVPEKYFSLENKAHFIYPSNWLITKTDRNEVTLKQPGGDFRVIFEIYQKDSFPPPLEAKLINEGLADIPNVDKAYVKIFDDQGIQKMEFDIFKGENMVRITVYPANSPLMIQFDNILKSMKID